jgi:hypothetical protein
MTAKVYALALAGHSMNFQPGHQYEIFKKSRARLLTAFIIYFEPMIYKRLDETKVQ